MSARFYIHTIFLCLAASLTYIWTTHPMYSTYTLQLVAILILLYFGSHFFSKKNNDPHNVVTLDLIILTSITLLLVTQTGGLASPLMFTIYFLLFAVALLFETEATLVLTGVLIIFLTLLPNTDLADLGQLTEIVALVMITPLAIFTGHQYELVLKEKELRSISDSHITSEETDSLMFLSLNLKSTLLKALDNLSLTIPQAKSDNIKNDLTQLYSDLRELYRSANELESSIDKETD